MPLVWERSCSRAAGSSQFSKIRDRMRTAKKRVVAIARTTGQTGPQREERRGRNMRSY